MIFWTMTQAGAQRLDAVDALALLSPVEAEKYRQMKFPKRRREWLLGRYTAKQLLCNCVKECQDIPLTEISVLNNPAGAPYFRIRGANPHPLQLTISHRDNRALCAISADERALGVDMERIEPRAEVFIEDYFTEKEKAFARSLPENKRVVWTTAAWSLKESALKALGFGLRVDTRKVEVDFLREPVDFFADAQNWVPAQVVTHNLGGEKFSAAWRTLEGYVLTLAYSGLEEQDACVSFCSIDPI